MEEIKAAKMADKEEILRLYRSQIGRAFCPWDEDYPAEKEVDYDLSRESVFVLKEEGRIIAAISLDYDENVEALPCWTKELLPGGELSRLAVASDMQGRGLAKRMILFGMEELRRRNYRSVHFLVQKHNEKAIRAYAPLDYSLVGECFLYGQPYFCYEKAL